VSSGARGRIAGTGLTAVVLLTACIGHLPPCPAAGGPPWVELQSAHFRLRTDQDPAAARATLTDLDRLEAALLTVFGAPLDLDTGRVPVVAVDRGWTDFAPRQVEGFYTHALFQPLVVMVAGGELQRHSVIKHELVHYLSGKIMRKQPPWLAEGLACYYETIRYDAEGGRIFVGTPPPDRLRTARLTGVATLEALFAAKQVPADDGARFYAAAWLTVHYLMNQRLTALAGYERALRDDASPEAAWTAAFGAQSPADLAAEVHRYLDGGRYAILIYAFPADARGAPPVAERRLTDADVHATRALLYLKGEQSRANAPELSLGHEDGLIGAKRELDEALRQQPDHVGARAIFHFMLGAPINFDRASEASRAHADDWLAWVLLADAARDRGDQETFQGALARAVETAGGDRSVMLPVVDLR